VFKGSGWYVNDSRNAKNSTSTSKSESADKPADTTTAAPKESSEKKAAATVGES
jgi:predicted nucleic acid-binding Zn ribbon protein